MSNMILVVMDTNALLSAILYPNSVPQQALSKVLMTGNLLFSQSTADEFQEVLLRPKFDRYLSVDERKRVILVILEVAQIIETTITITDCRDPKDNKFLEVAVSGKATFIISGDKDLLILNPYHGVSIVTPAQFLGY